MDHASSHSRIVNLVTAAVMVAGGIAQFFHFGLYVTPA